MEGKTGGKSVLETVLSLLHGKSADYECGNLFHFMTKKPTMPYIENIFYGLITITM